MKFSVLKALATMALMILASYPSLTSAKVAKRAQSNSEFKIEISAEIKAQAVKVSVAGAELVSAVSHAESSDFHAQEISDVLKTLTDDNAIEEMIKDSPLLVSHTAKVARGEIQNSPIEEGQVKAAALYTIFFKKKNPVLSQKLDSYLQATTSLDRLLQPQIAGLSTALQIKYGAEDLPAAIRAMHEISAELTAEASQMSSVEARVTAMALGLLVRHWSRLYPGSYQELNFEATAFVNAVRSKSGLNDWSGVLSEIPPQIHQEAQLKALQ